MKIVRDSILEIKRSGETLPRIGAGRVHQQKMISDWLDEHGIGGYEISDDLEITVNGDVEFFDERTFDHFPDFIRFREVKGSFQIDGSELIILRGCPPLVGGNFTCVRTKVGSLMFSPKKVGGNYCWYDNFANYPSTRIKSQCAVGGKVFTDASDHVDYIISLDKD